MKSDNKKPGIDPVGAKAGDYDNSINTGSVGFEGDGDNGASTLRLLKKKHANDTPDKKMSSKRAIL